MSNLDKDKGRLEPFIPMLKDTMRTPAWLAMSKGARWLFVVLKSRYVLKFHNNGKLYVSSRIASKEIGADQKEILRWYRELEYYGFIVKTAGAYLGVNGMGKAPHWRITELGTMDGGTLVAPTRDYLKWNGAKFRDKKTESRRGNPQRTAGEFPCTPDGEIPCTALENRGGNPLHVVSQTAGEIPLISSLTTGSSVSTLASQDLGTTALPDRSALKAA